METNVRETSLEAYNKIKENGLLSRRRFEVYEALAEHGPCSYSELFRASGIREGYAQSNISVRLSELRDLGVVEEIGTKDCSVTGRRTIQWDVTDKMPLPRQRKTQLDVLLEKERRTKNKLISLGLQIAKARDKDFKKRQTKLF